MGAEVKSGKGMLREKREGKREGGGSGDGNGEFKGDGCDDSGKKGRGEVEGVMFGGEG